MTSTKLFFPQAIYFDTNAIWSLHSGNNNIEISKLKTTISNLLIPEVAVKEHVHQFFRELKEDIQKLENLVERIKKKLQLGSITIDIPVDYFDSINKRKRHLVEDVGIKTIPMPQQLEIGEIIDLALKRNAPFVHKDSDKGFLDSLIVLTIHRNMLEFGYEKAIIISNDDDINNEEIKRKFKEHNLEIQFFRNVREVNQFLNERGYNLVRAYEESIKKYLDEKSSEIFKYILENGEISEEQILGRGIWGLDGEERADIDILSEINSIKPLKVVSVYLRSSKEDPPPEGFQSCTFSVELEIDFSGLKYRDTFLQPLAYYSISGPEYIKRNIEIDDSLIRKTSKINRQVFVDCYVKLDENTNERELILRKIH